MFKIPSKLSISVTLVISVLFFAACVAGMFFMPALTDVVVEAHNSLSAAEISANAELIIVILLYAVHFTAILADILLFILLMRIRQGKVFTPQSVSLIRGVAWCCILLCVIFFCLGLYFPIAFAVAFIAVFLGLCLRVVKNVIEEATEIKSENDLTV